MSETTTANESNTGYMARRPFMRALAGGATAAAVGGAGLRAGSQEAVAIAPAIIAGGVAGSIAIGWALREYEVIGSDAPPEGLTVDALEDQTYQTARTRESTNASTFIDNMNILDGVENTAYVDGKIAAIESLNNQDSQSDVQSAAVSAVDDYATTVKTNLIKSWNESVAEARSIAKLYADHPDTDASERFTVLYESDRHGGEPYNITNNSDSYSIDLPDGTTIDVDSIKDVDGNTEWHLTEVLTIDDTNPYSAAVAYSNDGVDPRIYLRQSDWQNVWDEIETTFTNVRDGLTVWVDTLYADVQSGDIEISELITPRERAEMMADDEDMAPAIADLIALNQNVDPEREATITLEDDNITLVGTFARTANPEGEPLEAGTTYDPSADLTGDVFFTYDVAGGEGLWNEFETGVDGGTVTFTSEPYEQTLYRIQTAADETAEVTTEDFTDEGDGTFTADISGQVETSITEVDTVNFYSESGETQYETVRLEQSFTIEKFENSDGKEVDSATFEQNSEPQDDTNYITQEEWDDLQAKNEELIDKYEESQNTGGGGLLPGFDGAGGPIAGAVIAVLVFLGLATASN